MMSRVGKTEGAGALHRGILEARLEKRAILPNFNVDIRDPKFLIGLRLTESNLRFRNFGFEMGFCPISQFPLLVTQVCCCPSRQLQPRRSAEAELEQPRTAPLRERPDCPRVHRPRIYRHRVCSRRRSGNRWSCYSRTVASRPLRNVRKILPPTGRLRNRSG